MFFFLFSLILCVCISAALFIGLLKALQINRERRNRRPVSYLTPVLLTLALLVLTISLTIPRLLDVVPLIAGSLEIEEIFVDASDIGWNTIRDGKRLFIYNQWKFTLKSGQTYQITYTPRSHVIMSMSMILEPVDAVTP